MNYHGKKIFYDQKGYPLIWLDGKSKKIHILEWEKHNGPKPDGMHIHHKDNDKKNWALNNLEIVSQSDHFRIHAGWKGENGVWVGKPCKDCKKILPLIDFYQRKGLTPSNRCIKCSGIYFKEFGSSSEFKARRKVYMKKYYQENKEKWQRN